MKVLVLAGLALWGTSSFAQDVQGVYIGVGLAQFTYKENGTTNEGVAFQLKDETDATKLYGGYRFNDTWAIEGSYGVMGDFRWSNTPAEKGDLTISTIGMMMHVNLFLLGFGYHDADFDPSLEAACLCTPEDGPFISFGAEWHFGRWSIRGQYEWYDAPGKKYPEVDTLATVDTWLFGLGADFRF